MSRYAAMFAKLRARGEGALGAFAMLGDPDLETSAHVLDTLVEAGADMLEVGMPFSDPVADGPVIQAAAQRALEQGVRQADCFELLTQLRSRHPHVPIGILTYANLVVAHGRNAFYRAVAESGADSVLVADVPVFEAAPFVRRARDQGIAATLIAAPNTPQPALWRIASLGDGFTYCVARAGVTGTRENLQLDHDYMLATLAAERAPPPIFGFGISRPDHVRAALDAGASGAICGSAIVKLIADRPAEWDPALRTFISAMKAASLAASASSPAG